ncbi:hypothetical protein [Cetobacterium somerae]
MEDNIEKYILEASDLELLSEGRLLITTENRKILLKGISKEKIDEYYEIFGKKFRKNKVKKSKYLRVFWSDDEIRYLKENYLKKDVNEIALVIKKSNYQINLMLGKLKLIVKREWSIEEVEFLKNNIENSTIRLAEELNRSVASIKAKKRLLRLLEI